MSSVGDDAARWAAERQRLSSVAAAEQAAAASFESRARADWPPVRQKILDAIAVVKTEVDATTFGASGGLSLTAGSGAIGSGIGGGIERFGLSVRCTNPVAGSLTFITAHPDRTVRFGQDRDTNMRVYGFDELLAGGAEGAVRGAVRTAVASMR